MNVAEYITAMIFITQGLIFNMIEIFDILHHIKEKTIKQIPKKYTIAIAAILIIIICIIVNIHAFVNIEKDICIKRLEFFNIMALLITVLADE